MSVTIVARLPEATMATIALVAVPLRLVATGKTTHDNRFQFTNKKSRMPHSLAHKSQISNTSLLQRPSQGRRRRFQGRRGCHQLWLQPVCHRHPPQAERG